MNFEFHWKFLCKSGYEFSLFIYHFYTYVFVACVHNLSWVYPKILKTTLRVASSTWKLNQNAQSMWRALLFCAQSTVHISTRSTLEIVFNEDYILFPVVEFVIILHLVNRISECEYVIVGGSVSSF